MIVKPPSEALTRSVQAPPTEIGSPDVSATARPPVQMYAASVTMIAFRDSRDTSRPLNRFTATAVAIAAGRANHSEPVSRNTTPQTTPDRASTVPIERSIWREMIEKVIAIAASASGVLWAMIAGIVRGLSQLGDTSQKRPTSATVIVPRNHTSR